MLKLEVCVYRGKPIEMAASLRASQEGLKIVDMARQKKGWKKTEDAWYGLATTSQATLKRFCRGIAIQRDTFIELCKTVGVNWEEVVDNSPPTPEGSRAEFFTYDDAWVGREKLVAQLKQKVEGSCRLLILVGITGIGKTALAEKLAVELHEDWLGGDWRKFHQENLEKLEQAFDFSSVASQWLEKWGERLVPEERTDAQRLLNRLVKRLRDNRYLLVIDSLENILEGNEEDGWGNFKDEWWGKFFERLLAVESCQSRIILTSQDLPQEIPERYKNFWHRTLLEGITEPERLALFEKTGLEVDLQSPNRSYLERIGAAYEGHPLALRTIAGEICSKPFVGNVVAYWKKYGNEIEEVEKAIEEAKSKGIVASADDKWKLDRYTRQLRKKVRDRLEKTFCRLKEDVLNAYRLLCEGARYRCPVPEEFWLSHLEDWDCDEEDRERALEVLRDRFLIEEVIEEDELKLRQHNLIRSVALEHLQNLEDKDE